jgi:hypothetical protein
VARTAYDIQLANLEVDLRERERRYDEHPTKANLRAVMAIRHEIRDLKYGPPKRNPMSRKRRSRRRRNPTSGEFFLFALGTAAGVVGLMTYQTYIAPKLLAGAPATA